jgi:hypothetical protein
LSYDPLSVPLNLPHREMWSLWANEE